MRQRTISDFFWRDPEISDLSQEDKATLLYFLTSPSSNIIGCYQVVWMIAAAEMGWTKDQLLVVARRLKARDLIDFNDEGWIWVKIWWQHNSPSVALNPKSKLITHAKKQCAVIPVEWLENFGKSLETIGVNTLEMGYPYPINGASNAPSNAPSHAPSHAPCDAPSENTQTHQQTGSDAPSRAPYDAPSHAPSDGGGDGSGGNRYLVSKTTTPNPSSNETGGQPRQNPVVVVDDLIFSPQTNSEQRNAIYALLTNSGVSPNLWQLMLDELHGAQLAQTIENPVGYMRGIASRALQGTFQPELALKIAEKRRNQNRPAPTIAVSHRDRIASDSVDLDRLPSNIRSSLARMAEQKQAGSAK